MTLKEMRKELANQIKLVRDDGCNIPQAETIANLAGKSLKVIQLELQAEIMKENGKKYSVLSEIIE